MSEELMLDSEYCPRRELTPAEKLLAAVIKQAIADGCDKPFCMQKIARENARPTQSKFIKQPTWNHQCMRAREWFGADNSTLRHFCSALGLNIDYIKKLANQIFDAYDEKLLERVRYG